MTSARSDFSRHVRVSLRKQKIMRLFQARISRLERGLVEISAVNRPDLEQQDGHVHAGALVTLADSAGGYAALSLLPPGSRVLTVEVKLNFLRPSVGSMIRGRGRVRNIGRTIAVCELTAMMKQERKWVTCAWGSQTIYCIRPDMTSSGLQK